ncbi:MAG: DUF488 domain-containing protein [Chloroflexi bacterium]|nr:DUF488 domain-containing protein [Chloroflexota bacterium]
MQIYTVGHSNHTPEKFLELLAKAKIEVLADVRTNPNSKWAPWANRDSLKQLLGSAGIGYLYLGDVLGGQPADPDSHDPETGKVDYGRIRQQEYFQRGLQRLMAEAGTQRVCIMCAEEDPGDCHRNLLVGESLRQQRLTIRHLRADGRIQTDEDVWKEKAGMPAGQGSLPL